MRIYTYMYIYIYIYIYYRERERDAIKCVCVCATTHHCGGLAARMLHKNVCVCVKHDPPKRMGPGQIGYNC